MSKSIAELERAYKRALAAEHKAVEAVPETPPRHEKSAATKAAEARAWEAIAKTNEARKALTAAYESAAKEQR